MGRRNRPHLIGMFAFVIALQFPASVAESGEIIEGPASVIDGDTIEIAGKKIGLHGIDAPETGQSCRQIGKPYPCGKQAAQALAELIENNNVRCDTRGRGPDNRIAAVCHAAGHNLSGWMTGQGWALAYRRHSRNYVAHEKSAASGKRGLWRGQFVAPWDWRRGNRLSDNQR